MGTKPVFDVEGYLSEHDLRPEAREYIRVCAQGLSRNVGQSGFPSVVTEFQSRKMQCTVNTESRSAEVALAIHLEMDSTVLAYFEQAAPIECMRSTKKGRRLTSYRADFLVLYRSGPVVLEAKTEERLVAKLQSHPADWARVDGRIADLAATAAFEAIGLKHRVVSSSDLCRYRTANYRLLIQARATSPATEELRARVEEAFAEKCAMTLAELGSLLGISDYSPLCSLIASGELQADLSRNLLAQPDQCVVATNAELLANLDAHLPGLFFGGPPIDGTAAPVARVPGSKQAERALKILRRLAKGRVPARSAARYRTKIREGAKKGLTPFQSVLPGSDRSGNREPKRPEIVLAFAENSLRDIWVTNEVARVGQAFATYKEDAKAWHPGCKPVSRRTFESIRDAIRLIAAAGRGGLRASNAASSPSPVSARVLGPTRPFELATCDHALAKIYVVVLSANGFFYVQRPWVTLLRDCCTKLVLALWVSFCEPSRLACAMVLRACLQRHGRLPEGIVSDGGPDFRSVYYSALLAHVGVDLVRRPSGHARYGSEAERFFGQFTSEWLSGRPGNLVDLKNLRAVSGSHKPERFAQIYPLAFLQELSAYAAISNESTGPSAVLSPQAQNAIGLEQFRCSGHVLPYDREFIVASAIDVGEFKLDPSRGLHIDSSHYWHPVLADPSLVRRQITARREPEDASIVYIKVRGNWYTAESGRSARLRTLRPIDRIVDRLLTVDAAEARALAFEDRQSALVRARRAADANLVPLAALAAPATEREPARTTDLFDEARDSELVAPDQMRWIP